MLPRIRKSVYAPGGLIYTSIKLLKWREKRAPPDRTDERREDVRDQDKVITLQKHAVIYGGGKMYCFASHCVALAYIT